MLFHFKVYATFFANDISKPKRQKFRLRLRYRMI